MKRNSWIILAAGLVVVGAAGWYFLHPGETVVKWRFAKVDKGNITQRISATGTLNALIQVPVGTQVSGVVTGLYADYNSLVKKGQVIAKIDPTVWETELKDAEAALQRAQVAWENAKVDYGRNKRLREQNLIADADLDVKDLALKTAAGNLESAQATLTKAKTDLSYCTILAPVDGVVISRLVDVGQTVAASFSTPNLFTIAQSLEKMKVEAAIDEADIGQVRVGQKAYFTVDSYPDKQFRGEVSEVQLNPIINQNVVTYNVVMAVANETRAGRPQEDPSTANEKSPALELRTARYIPPGSPIYQGDFALFPGMTANITIITNRRENVLRVPSSALRFNPAAFIKMDDKRSTSASGTPASGTLQRPGVGSASGKTAPGNTSRGMVAKNEDRIWVLDHDTPKAIPVKAGISDGQFVEISGDGITEGMAILTGVENAKKPQNGSASPLGGPGMPHH